MAVNTTEGTALVVQLLEEARESMPAGSTISVAGPLDVGLEVQWSLIAFGSSAADAGDEEGLPRHSAAAIVALERARVGGASFLAVPASANRWLEEVPVFAEHCRGRYAVIVDSAHLGTIFDLRAEAVAEELPVDAATSTDETTATADEHDDAIDALADALSKIVRSGEYSSETFRRFEQRGVHVTPVHFYSPLPDTSRLADEIWKRESELVGIDMNDEGQLHLLSEVFPQFRAEYEALPTSPKEDDPFQFYLGNAMFDGTDALVYYCMLRHLQPRRVIEVGSGHSTRLAAQAARVNGATELVCVEPYPHETLQRGFPGLTSVIASPVEEVSLDVFGALDGGDVLFIDSSHVVRVGGDVTYLYLEVLPRLKPGVVVHVHDVFFPREYPRAWTMDELRFWNEQYLLQTFLAFNSEFSVLLANSYLAARHREAMKEAFPTSPWWGGGSFWMERRR